MARCPRSAALLGALILACSSGRTTGAAGPAAEEVHLYPTAAGGRAWSLPLGADAGAVAWSPEGGAILRIGEGVFQTSGESGQVRLNVTSPAGQAWWRDVEMTAYFRRAGAVDGDLIPHWELYARGERHSSGLTSAAAVNGGVAAPNGTVSWPGYPFAAGALDAACLGTAYHLVVHLDGSVAFEKEVAHPDGYAAQRGAATVAGFAPGAGGWFGAKLVVRNGGGGVKLEAWIDAAARGEWALAGEAEDLGGWVVPATVLAGCDQPPFSYAPDEVLNWAAPWVTFRSDGMVLEFAGLSVRAINPAP